METPKRFALPEPYYLPTRTPGFSPSETEGSVPQHPMYFKGVFALSPHVDSRAAEETRYSLMKC